MDTSWAIQIRLSMRILFLDFDGVLHPGPRVESRLTHFCWLPILARALSSFADVQVVIHSTWRRNYDLTALQEMLGSIGRRVVDVTSDTDRWESIATWLAQHGARVRSYRVLDDEASEFPRPLPSELIECRPELGVSDRLVQEQLRAWLEA